MSPEGVQVHQKVCLHHGSHYKMQSNVTTTIDLIPNHRQNLEIDLQARSDNDKFMLPIKLQLTRIPDLEHPEISRIKPNLKIFKHYLKL